MANLIVNMLHMAGVKNAYHTWIGTRDLPYKYTEFPTPIVDNHMIATYISPEGKYIFLDGTGNYTKLGYPSSMIQGKEALISYGEGKYEVKVIPELNAEENRSVDSLKVKLDGNKISGSGKLSYFGYAKVFSGYDLDRIRQEEIRSAVLKDVTKGSNKFDLRKYEIAGLDDRDGPTTIRYEFSVPDYFQVVGDETYLNLNLSKERVNPILDPDRKSPVELEYKHVGNEIIEFEVPSNLTVEYLPPDATWGNELFSFKITYTNLPGKIVYQRQVRTNTLMISPNQFKEWNEGNKHLADAFKESIVLKKKS
jgi:hypothetical protein